MKRAIRIFKFQDSIQEFSFFLTSFTLVNTALFYWLSRSIDPSNESKLIYGVLSGEILLSSIVFIALFCIIYLLSSLLTKKYATVISGCIAFAVLSLVSLFSWHTYKTVGDFIGLYSFQMLYNDADQIFDIASRMPSMQSISGAIQLAAFASIILLISIFGKSLKKSVYNLSPILAIIIITTISWNSSYFNKMDKFETTGNEELDAKLSRINKTNFELISKHAGPYTKLVKDISLAMRELDNSYPIEKDKLIPREKTNDTTVLSAALSSEEKYNVVYILVESLRADIIGETNGDIPLMPFTSSLINKSYQFNNIWAQSSHSNYADITSISGQYPLRSENIHFYPENPKYPLSRPWEKLRQYDYASGLFSSQNENWGGMNNYIGADSLDIFDHVGKAGAHDSEGKRNTKASLKINDNGRYLLDYSDFMYRGSVGNSTQRYDEITIDRAINWVSELDQSKPFALYTNLQASHYPYNYFPSTFKRKHLLEETESADRVRRGEIAGNLVDTVKLAYFDSLEYVDQNIEKIVNAIESKNPNKTIYVITADTSTSIDSSYLGNGGTLFPEVLKIPLMIYDPRLEKAEMITAPTAQIDILPTIYGILGLSSDPAIQGIDVITNPPAKNRTLYAVSQTPAAHEYAVIEGDWELLFNYQTETKSALYVGSEAGIDASDMPEKQMQSMALKLQRWISTQLQYYSNEKYYKHYYPPAQSYYDSQIEPLAPS